MESEPDVECGSPAPGVGIGKSKLDTLSKEDLVKFAKKQMAVIQKLKLKCADTERESQKAHPHDSLNDTVVQELTERLEAVLLDKAQSQQDLVLLRKENAKLKEHAEESKKNLTVLQEKLDQAYKEHHETIKVMENKLETTEAKHSEELNTYKKREIEKIENDKIQRQRLLEEFQSNTETVRQEFDNKISGLKQDMELARIEWMKETETLKESHHMSLRQAQEDVENLQEVISRLARQHEDEIRDLEDQLEISAAHFDVDRERILLLQSEPPEQTALRDSQLQDVQEEEEDHNKSGGQKASEMVRLLDYSVVEEPDNQMEMLRLALQELQSQNSMLLEEVTYLRNVKTELEHDVKQLKEEFSMEREELEFKINELQMTKDESDLCPDKNINVVEGKNPEQHKQILQELKELRRAEMKELETNLSFSSECEKEALVQEVEDMQNACKVCSEEKNAIIYEYEHTKQTLRNLELELEDLKKSDGLKDQADVSIQELKEKLDYKDRLIEELKALVQAPGHLEQQPQVTQNLQNLAVYMEGALIEKQNLKSCIANSEDQLSNSTAEKDQLTKHPREIKLSPSDSHICENSMLHNHLDIKAQEENTACIRSNEETAKIQKELHTVLEENDALGNIITMVEGKLFDARRRICEILEVNYSVTVPEEEEEEEEEDDISSLLNRLQSRVQEELMGYKMVKEENAKFQNDILTLAEERDALKTDVEKSHGQLCDARRYICKLLEQRTSANIVEEDISVLLNHLLSNIHEEKNILLQQLEEQAGQLEQTMGTDSLQVSQQQSGLSVGRSLLNKGLSDMLSDNEHLQGQTKTQTQYEKKTLENNEQHEEQVEQLVCKEYEDPSDKSGTQETDDMKTLQQKLTDKETITAHLKDEISCLQEYEMSRLNKNIKQMEILEKECKEKDERLNKIKAVAVKARKELDNSRKEVSVLKEELETLKSDRDKMSETLKGIIHGAVDYKNLMIDYEKQTELLDKEREKIEAAEKLNGELTKHLKTAVEQHKQLLSERDDLIACIETLQSNVQQREAQVVEAQKLKSAMEKDLEAEMLLKEQKTKDYNCAVKQVEELQTLLHKQNQQLHQTEQELEQLRKDAQQSTLLDMEIADYERLVNELNQQLSVKNKLLEERESQALVQREREEKLTQEIEFLKTLVDTGEEKASKLKQLLLKAKKDLTDVKKEEASQMVLHTTLKGELEASQQQLESYKIHCSELTADRHMLQQKIKLLCDQHQKIVVSYQEQTTTLQNNLSSAKAELQSTLSEFDSYKVRVHNVLKQQKNRTSTNGDGEFSRQEREHMESKVEQLRSKLQESLHNLQSSNAELQQLQTEHDTLLEHHNKMLQQTVVKEAELRERFLSLHSENISLKAEHSQTVAQLTAQTEVLRSSFRDQVHHLQDEHRGTIETLQQQINYLETQLFQLQKEPANTVSPPLQQRSRPLLEKRLVELSIFELNMTREEGEGMETTEKESTTTAGTPPSSLEQLLTSPDPKNEPFVWKVEATKDELTQKLDTATRSMEHMNSLLHESEATNAILMEQISLLKSELRRLERNQEREKSVANLEYLKNVLLQFIFLRPGSEKQALLPVIHTMLQLSPEEKNKLAAIAQGEEEASESRSSGWTSYLHSWSGIR